VAHNPLNTLKAQAQPARGQLQVMRNGASGGMPLNQRPEDASYVMGAQGLVPQNADVAHFQGGRQEDNRLVANQQGYGMQSNDIANFQVPQGNVSQIPFNPGYTPLQGSAGSPPQFQGYNAGQGIQAQGHMNPQLKDTGYFWNN